MSDSTSQRLIEQATLDVYSNRALISGTFLVIYDYFLTLPTEVSEIWNSKFSGAQACFFVTRYSYIVYTLFLFALNFVKNPSQTFCRVVSYNYVAWSIPPHLGLYAIYTLRTYAVYQKSLYILIILGLTSVATCVVDLISIAWHPQVIRYNIGVRIKCVIETTDHLNNFRYPLVGQVLGLILDILVFGFTFAKTIRHTIEMRRVGLGNGIGYFILRDGVMYFLVKLMFGVLGTGLFFIPVPFGIGDWLRVIVQIGNPVALVLVSRLVLNLRQVSCKQEAGQPTLGTIDTIRDPVFATNSILGNIGAQLRVHGDEDDEIDDVSDNVEFDVGKKNTVADENEITEGTRAATNFYE